MMQRIGRITGCGLAALALAASTAGPAGATTNTPSKNSLVTGPGCDGGSHFGWGGSDWPNFGNGDYNGSLVYGIPSSEVGTCSGGSNYWYSTVGTATDTAYWYFGQGRGDGSVAGRTCYVWVYILNGYATDVNARYDIWGLNSSTGQRQWLFWPGRNINQDALAGWIFLGQHSMGSNDTIELSLGNNDSQYNDMVGAGSAAFICS